MSTETANDSFREEFTQRWNRRLTEINPALSILTSMTAAKDALNKMKIASYEAKAPSLQRTLQAERSSMTPYQLSVTESEAIEIKAKLELVTKTEVLFHERYDYLYVDVLQCLKDELGVKLWEEVDKKSIPAHFFPKNEMTLVTIEEKITNVIPFAKVIRNKVIMDRFNILPIIKGLKENQAIDLRSIRKISEELADMIFLDFLDDSAEAKFRLRGGRFSDSFLIEKEISGKQIRALAGVEGAMDESLLVFEVGSRFNFSQHGSKQVKALNSKASGPVAGEEWVSEFTSAKKGLVKMAFPVEGKKVMLPVLATRFKRSAVLMD